MSNYNTLKTADTINTVSVVDGAITTSKLGASVTTLIVAGGGPKATAITYPGNDLAADPAGGQTITLTGTGFVAGCSVFVGTVQASVVTVVSATSVTFTSPALAAATYTLYLVNPDGGTATIVPGISYSGTPAWSTAAGTLGSVYEYSAVSNTVAATGDGSITYSVFSGTLPTGSSLNTSTGVISGTSPASAGATTYTFVIRATDAQLQDSDRSFSITVNTDTVTWSSPAADSTVTLDKDLASTTALLATSAAGKAITYTSTTLPTGLTISGATVTGTPTAVATTATTFTATAATTGKTATAVINWTVSVAADTYFQNTTLLLSGAVATETFVSDASVNNFAVTIAGDTKPNNFNPYTPGYYSNYFDGTGDYLTVPSNAAFAMGSGDFIIEMWVYPVSIPTDTPLIDGRDGAGTAVKPCLFIQQSSNNFIYYVNGGIRIQGGTPSLKTWQHVALVRNSGSTKLYINGTQAGSTYTDTNNYLTCGYRIAAFNDGSTSYCLNGYISNVRVVNGVAVYTGTFTPPTAPLTATQSSGTNISAITGTATSLLTCQSNRFVDNSTNAYAITKVGDTTVSPTTPFVPNTAYATYGSTYFDGTGDYLSIANNVVFDYGTGDCTFEVWVYIQSYAQYQFIVYSQVVGTTSGNGYQFYVTNSGYLAMESQAAGVAQGITATNNAISLNTWTHVAFTRASGTNRLFVNGNLCTTTGTLSQAISTGGNAVYLGAYLYSTTTYYFNGYISNVRLVKGTAVYTSAFTPPTAPLTAITNTSLLTLQTNQPVNNNVFLDNSTNAFAVTRAGNVSAGTFTPYGANWSNYFDGTGDKLTLPSSSAFDLSDSTWTIEFWMYSLATPPGGNDCRLLMAGANGGAASWDVQYNNNASIGFFRPYGGSPTAIYSSAGTIALNTWYHIAIVCNAGSARLYINGVSVAGPVTISLPTSAAQDLRIGYDDPGTVNFQYNGYLSNVRIVKGVAVYTGNFTVPTALTATQSSGTNISAITGTATSLLTCQSNRFVDNSTNAFVATITGNVAVQRFSPFSPQTQTANTHSAYFDGTGDYLTVPASQGAAWNFTGDFTFECWICPNPLTGYHTLLGQWGSGDNTLIWKFNGSGRMYFENLNGAAITATSTTIVANQWQHIALTRSSNTIRMFVNGVQDATTATRSQIYNSSGPMLVGASGVAEAVNGYISNMRIVKGVAVYTVNFTVPTAPLTATQAAGTNIAAVTGTQTSLLTCQSPTFIDNSTNAFAITAFGDTKPRTLNPFGFTNASAAYSAAVFGGSAYFDGTTDSLAAPANSAFQFTGDYTVEFWVNFSSVSTEVDLVGNYTSNVGTDWMILRTANGTFQYYPSSAASYIVGPTPIVNRWYHVVIGRSGTSCKLYVDGISYGTALTFSGTLGDASKSVYIGSRGGSANILTGYISNVRIVKGTAVYTSNFVPPSAPLTAITNTSLLLNMTSAGIVDATMINSLETVADAKRVATHTPYAGSYYSNLFDGTGDYLTAGTTASNFLCTGSASGITATFEAWVYLTAYNTGGSPWMFSPVHSKGVTYFNFGVASGKVRFYWNGGGLGNIVESASTSDVPLNTWTHIALTISGTTFKIYVNGTLNTTSVTNSGVNAAGSGAAENIGYEGNQPTYFTGYISNYRLTNTLVYSSTFTPSITPLTAISGTQLLTCQSNRFVDNSTNLFAVTRTGDTSVQSFNPFQRNSAATMSFDGTGDALTLPANNVFATGTRDFTIEGWIYVTDLSAVRTICGTRTPPGTTTGWNLAVLTTGSMQIYDNTEYAATGAGSVAVNTWCHFAFVRLNNVFYSYLNGIQKASSACTRDWTQNTFWVGATGGSSEPFLGYINDLRFTKSVARYTTTFTPPTTAFVTK